MQSDNCGASSPIGAPPAALPPRHLPWRDVSIGDGPPISTSLTAAEAARLAELATATQVLEVGSAYGYSALVMATTAVHVLAVDVHSPGPESMPNSLEVMRANIAAYDRQGQVTIAVGHSGMLLPNLVESGGRFGLVFIDGDHTQAAAYRDLVFGSALVAPGGALAVHDYGEASCPGVRAAVDDLFPAERITGNVRALEGALIGMGDELVDTLWIRWKR